MQQIAVDLFNTFHPGGPYATVITTNGDIDSMGQAVMGKGVALKAAKIWPEIRTQLGKLVDVNGNHCYVLPVMAQKGAAVVSFPTKHHWKNRSDLKLIEQSAWELSVLASVYEWEKVFMPRPGCGNGRLLWRNEVEPILADILDDRFIVCFEGQEQVRGKPVIKRGVKI